MVKDKKYIVMALVIIVAVIFISYFIFTAGFTKKIKGEVIGMTAMVEDATQSDLPIINYVINSSGENVVNTDVALIINAVSKYDINKIEYSFDLKKWNEVTDLSKGKEIDFKLVFSNSGNRNVYVRVYNDHGYRSYPYKTVVNIDKENPVIEISTVDDLVILAKDNNALSYIQYSNDKINWDDEDLSGEEVMLRKKDFNYKYIRVVDIVGNVSKIKEVGK